MFAGRFKELVKKYGKVGLGVHFTISTASITSLYVAINNNVDVESMLEKVGMPSLIKDKDNKSSNLPLEDPKTTTGFESGSRIEQTVEKERNRTTELLASSGGAFALALLINKALFPVRVPITLAVTPPLRRFLVRYNIIKNSV